MYNTDFLSYVLTTTVLHLLHYVIKYIGMLDMPLHHSA